MDRAGLRLWAPGRVPSVLAAPALCVEGTLSSGTWLLLGGGQNGWTGHRCLSTHSPCHLLASPGSGPCSGPGTQQEGDGSAAYEVDPQQRPVTQPLRGCSLLTPQGLQAACPGAGVSAGGREAGGRAGTQPGASGSASRAGAGGQALPSGGFQPWEGLIGHHTRGRALGQQGRWGLRERGWIPSGCWRGGSGQAGLPLKPG